MEELNKTQLILLAVFIAFVTSVATGVITVSLMDQSPPSITRTINRVVERTIEKVTSPGETKEVRVVVREDDLVAEAVKKARPGVLFITGPVDKELGAGGLSVDGDINEEISSQTAGVFDSLSGVSASSVSKPGTVISRTGLVVTSAEGMSSAGAIYLGELDSGKKVEMFLVGVAKENNLALLKINKDNLADTVSLNISESDPELGQNVIALGFDAEGVFEISAGMVTKIFDNEDKKAEIFKINAPLGLENFGAPVLTLDGDVLGVVVSKTEIIASGLLRTVVKKIESSASSLSDGVGNNGTTTPPEAVTD